MSGSELAVGVGLVAVLLGLAGYYAWRQRRLLRHMAKLEDAETRQWLHTQIRRRLICSVLLVLLAGMLVFWWTIEGRLGQAAAAPNLKADRQLAAEIFVYYWALFLLILLAVLVLAALDVLANARFGYRQLRKLDAARQTMIEEEAAKIRHRHNGGEGSGGFQPPQSSGG